MKKTLLFAAAAGLFLSTSALAGGYQLFEFSVTNLGRAFGGAGLVGDDYSAIAFNPAGMRFKGDGIQIGGNYVNIRAKGKGRLVETGSFGEGEIKTRKVLPHLFVQKQINEKFTIGTGVYVPFGLGTYYKKGWFGSTHALNSEINVIDIAVAASYKITDNVSVGASVYAENMDARLTNRLPVYGTESDLNADDWSKGYSLGLTFTPYENTRFGISYRSKVIHNIKGPHYFHLPTITFTGDCGTKLVLPEHILLSAYQKVGSFGLSAMARWTRWSRFDNLAIHSQAYRQATGSNYLPTVKEDWRNVWMAGLGLDYYMNDNWTLRTGVAFDQGAVKRATTRTARVPDSNRWIASVGAGYTVGNWQFDAAYAHMFLKNAHVYNKASGTTLDAKYSMGINLLGLSAQYNF